MSTSPHAEASPRTASGKGQNGRRVNLGAHADTPRPPPGYAGRWQAKTPNDDDLTWQVAANANERDKWAMAWRVKAKELQRLEDKLGYLPDDDESALTTFSEGTMTAADFAAQDLPELTWIVPGMIPAAGLGLLLAAEKTGKSLIALDCGIAVAQGTEFDGQATTQANVLFIELEGSPAGLQKRIRKMTLYGDVPKNLYIRHRKDFDLTNNDHLAGLKAFIIEHKIGLVFMGPLAQIGNLEDENSAAAIGPITRALNEIITATGCTITLIHHRKKPSGNDSYASVSTFFATSRGSSALMAAVDFAIGLQRAQEDPIGKMFVSLRDDSPSISGYRLDLTTLRISPSDETTTNKTDQRKAALISHMIDNSDPITRREVEALLKISSSTAGPILSNGVEGGEFEKLGTGNAVSYVLTAKFRAEMTRDPKAENGLQLLAGGAK